MKQKIFITGAGGYIGSHVTRQFLQLGHQVLAFDDFSTGFLEPLEILSKQYKGLTIKKGDIRNTKILAAALGRFRPDLVIHLSARCSVDESMRDPFLYFSNNSFGMVSLLEAMRLNKIHKLIFSSTCAVYGEAQKLPVDEHHPCRPTNPYGDSKVMCEQAIKWFGQIYGISAVIFRYFNVCGAASDGMIGDSKKPSLLLLQNAVRGAMGLEKFFLTCPSVPTPDHTPIRDYIDVEDLARAHQLAWRYLNSRRGVTVINLGSGKGFSVKQIIQSVEKVFGKKIAVHKTSPRRGEYARLYADTRLAGRLLKFWPRKTLRQSILSLKKWYGGHPGGYKF